MTKQTEAMKLALEALAVKFSEGWHEGIKIDASDIMLLNQAAQALAEQPAQQEPVIFYRCNGCGHAYEQMHPTSCDCMEAGGFDRVEYYTSPQPPQHEPVAWMTHEVSTGTQVWLYEKTAQRYQNPPTPLYTSPPQREPLTDEEIGKAWSVADGEHNASASVKRRITRAIESTIKGDA